jgi:hypothetical protein
MCDIPSILLIYAGFSETRFVEMGTGTNVRASVSVAGYSMTYSFLALLMLATFPIRLRNAP